MNRQADAGRPRGAPRARTRRRLLARPNGPAAPPCTPGLPPAGPREPPRVRPVGSARTETGSAAPAQPPRRAAAPRTCRGGTLERIASARFAARATSQRADEAHFPRGDGEYAVTDPPSTALPSAPSQSGRATEGSRQRGSRARSDAGCDLWTGTATGPPLPCASGKTCFRARGVSTVQSRGRELFATQALLGAMSNSQTPRRTKQGHQNIRGLRR